MTWAILLAISLWLAKKLASPSLDEVGGRLARHTFPAGKATTYRLAITVARVAAIVAPRRTPARGSSLGAMNEIRLGCKDDLGGLRPLTLARSLLRPALMARLRWLVVEPFWFVVVLGIWSPIGFRIEQSVWRYRVRADLIPPVITALLVTPLAVLTRCPTWCLALLGVASLLAGYVVIACRVTRELRRIGQRRLMI